MNREQVAQILGIGRQDVMDEKSAEILGDMEHRIQRLEELVYRLSKVLNLAGSLLRISSVIEVMSKEENR